MNELIKVGQSTFNNEVVQTVNARELYEFLEVSSRFNDWIKNRIEKYEFIENQDFIWLTKNLVSGGQVNEYHISLDMAKGLSMVERNDKGKQARKYFIQCEKQLKQVSVHQPSQLLPNEERAFTLAKPAMEFALMLGLDTNAAAVSASQAAFKVTGVNPLVLLGQSHLIAENQKSIWLTPTEIGKELSPNLSARVVNTLLGYKGYQYKIQGQWVATDKADGLYRLLDTMERHTDGSYITQMKWSSNIVCLLQ